MSTEENQPSDHPGSMYGEDGQGAGNGAVAEGPDDAVGQDGSAGSNTSRRRRRRRKHKSASAVHPAAPQLTGSPLEGTAEIGSAETVDIPVTAQQGPSAPQTASGQTGSSAGKRKKRKRKSGGGGENAPQPGNAIPAAQNGNGEPFRSRQNRPAGSWKRREEGPDGNREGARGGFGNGEHYGDANGNRRKGKFGGKGGGFVGPMDHSYRLVNGNVAERSSNAPMRVVNGNLRRFDDIDVEPVGTIREDAPTRIICFIEDLFVVTKMQETARKMGVKVQFAKANKETLAAIMDAPEAERPSLIVFDLNNAGAKPLTTIPKLKGKLKRSTSVIGFLQHIQGDLKVKAMEAGCDTVMPKSAFSQNVPNLLRRHGVVEEEELAEA